jgi:hypothetical protein
MSFAFSHRSANVASGDEMVFLPGLEATGMEPQLVDSRRSQPGQYLDRVSQEPIAFFTYAFNRYNKTA